MVAPAAVLETIAHTGTQCPDVCGLAIFAQSLQAGLRQEFPNLQQVVVAVTPPVQPGKKKLMHHQSVLTFDRDNPRTYDEIARAINESGAQVVVVQHEFGIYGQRKQNRARIRVHGVTYLVPTGEYLLRLMRLVEIPIITVFHTVLPRPDDKRRRMLANIAALSTAVVAMTRGARKLLIQVYEVSPKRIRVIPHGTPAMPDMSQSDAKRALRAAGVKIAWPSQGKITLVMIGFLKDGTDQAIRALARLRAEGHDAELLIAGRQHPGTPKKFAKKRRRRWDKLIERLGLAEYVHITHRYMTEHEQALCKIAADIGLVLNTDPDQAFSGPLQELAAACPKLVANRFPHAIELVRPDHLVKIGSPKQLAKVLTHTIHEDPNTSTTIRPSESTLWPNVARQFYELCLWALANPRAAKS